jgi:hypothetical protein
METITSINVNTKYEIISIKSEDKNVPKQGQIVITLLNKARQLLKMKKLNITKLKIICFDEADYFFKEQSDTEEFSSFNETVK